MTFPILWSQPAPRPKGLCGKSAVGRREPNRLTPSFDPGGFPPAAWTRWSPARVPFGDSGALGWVVPPAKGPIRGRRHAESFVPAFSLVGATCLVGIVPARHQSGRTRAILHHRQRSSPAKGRERPTLHASGDGAVGLQTVPQGRPNGHAQLHTTPFLAACSFSCFASGLRAAAKAASAWHTSDASLGNEQWTCTRLVSSLLQIRAHS